jgi:hypothetical protein
MFRNEAMEFYKVVLIDTLALHFCDSERYGGFLGS